MSEELERRIHCYHERLIRGLFVGQTGWERAAGWGESDEAPYLPDPTDKTNIPYSWSSCDVLRYRKPPVVSCDPPPTQPDVLPLSSDTSIFSAIARMETVRREPKRQLEVFGWQTPKPQDSVGRAEFEKAKRDYWARITDEALRLHLAVLKDTADFHANYVLRLIYLYGEVPFHLRRSGFNWREADELGRSPDFSQQVETDILDGLLQFKYWITDPFHPDDHDRPDESKRLQEARRQAWQKSEATWSKDDDRTGDMTYWSENHQILFATAEYLAGQLMPDRLFRAGLRYRSAGGGVTRAGDLVGEQRMKQAKLRLLRWLDDRLRFGLSEWRSPGYYAEDLVPLFNLADFCQDEQIQTRACMVLDLMAFELARLSHAGSFGGTAGRCYYEHKICGYDQSVGDLMEVCFGTRGGVVMEGGSWAAGSFASTRRYDLPDAIVSIATDSPTSIVDRSRVSISFDEAATYGIGFEQEDDVLFWWSRAGFFTKQVIEGSRRVANERQLIGTNPFKPMFKATGAASALFSPFSHGESKAADLLSVMLEGSVLTRANLYTYRNRHAMLSSAQNFRAGQFGLQIHPCQATLSMGATVWTTHPSAGAYITRAEAEAGGATSGGILGGLVGAAFGPVGMVVGAAAGAVGGYEAGKAATSKNGKEEPVELYKKDLHDGPNWWTGSVTLPRVVQARNAAIMAYEPHEIQRLLFGERTHAWFPRAAFDPGSVLQTEANCNVSTGLWTFGKVGEGYVGLFSGQRPVWTTDGPFAGKELIADGSRNAFILQVGAVDDFGSYERFVKAVKGARIHISGLNSSRDFECSFDLPQGDRLELHYDKGEVRYAGRPFSDDDFPRFETPYVQCGRVDWDQYAYTIRHAGHSVTHDFREIKYMEKDARVARTLDGGGHDCNEDAFLVIGHHGAPKTYPENTVQSCRHAVQDQHANALEIDLCLTRDGEVVLWHDWSPDDLVAVARELELQSNNLYKPRVPEIGSGWREPVIDLSLADFRDHYGYELIDDRQNEDKATEPVDPRIPTLKEFMEQAMTWPGLVHVFLDVKMPDGDADAHGAEMLRRVVSSIPARTPFRFTLMVPHEKVLDAMKSAAPAAGFKGAFTWDIEFPAGFILDSDDYSAIDAAIAKGNSVASVGRPTSLTFRGWHVYKTVIEHDVPRWRGFNLNPKLNKGRQIDKLIAWTIDDEGEMEWLVSQGVSGVITDDVPMLTNTAARARGDHFGA